MVSASLCVQSSQVQSHLMSQFEELLRQLLVQQLSWKQLLGWSAKETPDHRIDATFLHDPERGKESLVQRKVAFWDGLEGLIQSINDRVDEGVAKSEGTCGKRVHDAGIHTGVVSLVLSHQRHAMWSQNAWQPVLIGDVLVHGSHDLARLVVDHVAVPVWIEAVQLLSHSVVLTEPERMHGEQTKLFVAAVVSSLEAWHVRCGGIHLAVNGFAIVGRRHGLPWGHDDPSPQQALPCGEVPQAAGIVLWVTVDIGGIDVGGDQVELITMGDLAEHDRGHPAATHGTWAGEANAAPMVNTWVIIGYRYRKAGWLIVTGLVAEAAIREASIAGRDRHKVKVVVQELAPLHEHVCVLLV